MTGERRRASRAIPRAAVLAAAATLCGCPAALPPQPPVAAPCSEPLEVGEPRDVATALSRDGESISVQGVVVGRTHALVAFLVSGLPGESSLRVAVVDETGARSGPIHEMPSQQPSATPFADGFFLVDLAPVGRAPYATWRPIDGDAVTWTLPDPFVCSSCFVAGGALEDRLSSLSIDGEGTASVVVTRLDLLFDGTTEISTVGAPDEANAWSWSGSEGVVASLRDGDASVQWQALAQDASPSGASFSLTLGKPALDFSGAHGAGPSLAVIASLAANHADDRLLILRADGTSLLGPRIDYDAAGVLDVATAFIVDGSEGFAVAGNEASLTRFRIELDDTGAPLGAAVRTPFAFFDPNEPFSAAGVAGVFTARVERDTPDERLFVEGPIGEGEAPLFTTRSFPFAVAAMDALLWPDTSGGLLVWEERGVTPTASASASLTAQRIDDAGELVGPPFAVTEVSDASSSDISLLPLSGNRAFVLFNESLHLLAISDTGAPVLQRLDIDLGFSFAAPAVVDDVGLFPSLSTIVRVSASGERLTDVAMPGSNATDGEGGALSALVSDEAGSALVVTQVSPDDPAAGFTNRMRTLRGDELSNHVDEQNGGFVRAAWTCGSGCWVLVVATQREEQTGIDQILTTLHVELDAAGAPVVRGRHDEGRTALPTFVDANGTSCRGVVVTREVGSRDASVAPAGTELLGSAAWPPEPLDPSDIAFALLPRTEDAFTLWSGTMNGDVRVRSLRVAPR